MKSSLPFCLFLFFILSCNSENSIGNFTVEANIIDTDQSTANAKLESLIQIAATERSESGTLKKENLPAMLSQLLGVFKKYPNNEKTKEYCFRVVDLLEHNKDHKNAVSLFQLIVKSFPKSEKVGHAQLRLGISLQNNFNKKEEAITTYRSFIKDYPEHPLVSIAESFLYELTR